MLNLRSVYTASDPDLGALNNVPGSTSMSDFSDIRFVNTIVGNLGAPLVTGPSNPPPAVRIHRNDNLSFIDCDEEDEEEYDRRSQVYTTTGNPLMAGLDPNERLGYGNGGVGKGVNGCGEEKFAPLKLKHTSHFDLKFDYRLSVVDLKGYVSPGCSFVWGILIDGPFVGLRAQSEASASYSYFCSRTFTALGNEHRSRSNGACLIISVFEGLLLLFFIYICFSTLSEGMDGHCLLRFLLTVVATIVAVLTLTGMFILYDFHPPASILSLWSACIDR